MSDIVQHLLILDTHGEPSIIENLKKKQKPNNILQAANTLFMQALELQEDAQPSLREHGVRLLEHLVRTRRFVDPESRYYGHPWAESSDAAALMRLCTDVGCDDLLVQLVERISSSAFGSEASPSDPRGYQFSLLTDCHPIICDIIKVHGKSSIFKDCVRKMRSRLLKLAASQNKALTRPTADVIVTSIRREGTTASFSDLCVHRYTFCDQLIRNP